MHDALAYVQQIAVNNDNNSTSNASPPWDLAEVFAKPVHWKETFSLVEILSINNSASEILF